MFLSLLKKTLLPFGLPLVLIIAVFLLARNRFKFLARIPVWVWLLVILLIVVVWVLVVVLSLLAERRRARAIEAGIMKQAQWNVDNATPARRAEIEEIRRNMGEAMAILRKGPDGKKALYSLPWYLIIGPPAIGKTTAIVNSGLNFPGMTTARRMRGAGGTRNCDWWFSTDAILLDTAGRYAQSADRSETEHEWFGFLDLLKKHRSRGPINGLILGYSMETLIQADETRLVNDARELRQRMDEILDRLGWTFPVYVLFTKSDLLSGFADFFSSLSPVERQQVWGATYPITAGADQNAAERFLAEFDALCRRLRDLRIRRMAALDRGDAWGRTFLFAEEFSALRGKLHLFIETLFEPNPFRRDVPLFRGTYFSSGKQLGKPFDLVVRKIQALLGSGARMPELDAQPEKEDAYFVRDLFSKVLKGDRDLVRHTHSAGARFVRLQLAVSAGVLALSLLSCLWIMGSCTRLGVKMDATKNTAVGVRAEKGAALDAPTLDKLDRLRRTVRGSWRAFPLNVVNKVREPALGLYLAASRERVLEPLEEKIAEDLSRPQGLNADQVRRALRAELLLVDPAGADNFDASGDPADDLGSVLGQYGFTAPDAGGQRQEQLKGLADEFLKAGQPLRPLDSRRSELVAGARRLDQTHALNEYFDGLVAAASRCAGDLTLKSLAGDQALLNAGGDAVVRAAFTKTGWQKCVSTEFKEVDKTMEADGRLLARVGVTPSHGAPTPAALMDLYVDAYPEEWRNFLMAVRFRDHKDCAEAAADMKTLKKRKGSPLIALLETASQEASPDPGLIGSVLGSKPLDTINGFMKPLTAFAAPGGKDQPSPVDEYADQLGKVYDQLAACADDPAKAAIDPAVLRKASDWASDYADRFTGSPLASAMEMLLKRPMGTAQSTSQSVAGQQAQGAFSRDIADFFRDKLGSKYPFTTSDDMASPDDVVAFFGPDGKLDKLAKGYEDAGKPVPPKLKDFLDKAGEVRSALKITSDGLKAAFNMEAGDVRAIEGSQDGAENLKRIDQLTLVINGVSLVDQLAGTSRSFTWSSGDDKTACSLALNYSRANSKIGSMEYDSVWGVCQLFDNARAARQGNGTKLTFTFKDEGVAVDFLVTMKSGAECPFARGSVFRNFGQYIPASIAD